MKEFLCVYTGSKDKLEAWEALTQEERANKRQEGVKAWRNWAESYRAKIVSHGGPLSETKAVTAEGISDTNNNLTAYVIVHAASHDDAARMFVDHPHFAIFPGEAVEIMEVMEL